MLLSIWVVFGFESSEDSSVPCSFVVLFGAINSSDYSYYCTVVSLALSVDCSIYTMTTFCKVGCGLYAKPAGLLRAQRHVYDLVLLSIPLIDCIICGTAQQRDKHCCRRVDSYTHTRVLL